MKDHTMVTVHTDPSYDVHIGSGILAEAGAILTSVFSPGTSCCLVTDETVGALYGDAVRESLRAAGYEVTCVTIPAGEEYKTFDTYRTVLSFLASVPLTRSDFVAALGGGVVSDLAGFAAATYLRGIPFVTIPTTLLAASDASVGGKCAVDLPEGKNLAGAFHQPSAVICDTAVFSALPKERIADGMAETIKHGLIADAAFDAFLATARIPEDLPRMIERNVSIKSRVVAEDERDRGLRQILNFGHTIGHAIEKESNFSISHGEAVAIGMVCEARAAAAFGLVPDDHAAHIGERVRAYGLPDRSPYPAERLTRAALHDKKRSGDTIGLVCLEQIGSAIVVPFPVAKLPDYFRAGCV